MPPPTNTTAATATVLTMPYSTVQDVIGATPPNYEVWYTYVPVSADIVMSFWANGNAATGYLPQTDVYTGTASSLTALGITTTKPITITVDVTTHYFFRVRQSSGTPSAALLAISTGRAQNLSSGSGAIGINDDVPDYPLAIYTGTDGTVTQYRPNFPAGETAEMLPSGISLWHDRSDDSVLRLYDATLTLIASPSYPHVRNPPITSNRSNTFYIAEPGHWTGVVPVVSTFSTAGVLGPTTWTLPLGSASILAMAPAHDGSILYYLSSSSGTAIKRWSLTTNTAMSDLVAAVAPYTNMVADLLVLNDGSIIAAYVKNTSTFANEIRRYNAAGALLNSIPYTYPYGGHGIFLHHLTQAIDDPTAFWVWIYQADTATGAVNGLSTFEKRRASDGALLATFDAPQYHAGEYLGTPGTSPTRFGHSDCCPFVTLPPLPPYAPPDTPPEPPEPPGPEDLPPYVAPSYDLDARYIRRLRRAPHLDTEHVRIFYKKFELDLERGVGLATGGDPIVMLRLSRDGGHTWSEPVLMGAGRMGEYTKRAIARRLGHARDTVFEVTVSDPVAWSLVGAWLDLEPGTS